MDDKTLLETLKCIENNMDLIDGARGNYWGDKELCFWCGSKEYNSIVGVIHDVNCAKFQVRHKINKINNKK